MARHMVIALFGRVAWSEKELEDKFIGGYL